MDLEKPKSKKKLLTIGVLSIIAIGLIAIAASKFFTHQKAGGTLAKSTDRPNEVSPDKAGYNWQGGPDDPKKIKIEKIGVDNYIQKVGKNQDSEVAAPNNIYIAGWYTNSSRPGKKGLSVIDGHLDGYSKPGIFKNLANLNAGDEFTVVRGDDSVIKYKVLNVQEVDTSKAVGYIFSQNPKVKNQLNLVTCGGNYDQSKHLYNKRVIVSAEQIS